MYYCEECKKKLHWPESMSRSRGKCEVCGLGAVCYDVPSKYLPEPPKIIKQRWSTFDIELLAAQITELVEQYDLEVDTDTTDLAVDFVFSLLAHNGRDY